VIRGLSIRKRLVVYAATGVTAIAAMLGVAASPAQASANCFNGTGGSMGFWTTQKSYTYAAGGWCMYASWGHAFRLVWQSDGNLVAYHNASANNPADALWSTGIKGSGSHLKFQTDGNIVIYNIDGIAVFATHQGIKMNSGTSFVFLIQNTTSTRIYLRHFQQSPHYELWAKTLIS
jgi:hypothetical protein